LLNYFPLNINYSNEPSLFESQTCSAAALSYNPFLQSPKRNRSDLLNRNQLPQISKLRSLHPAPYPTNIKELHRKTQHLTPKNQQ